MEKTYNEIIADLSNIQRVENIKTYTLVNNYGADFTKDGVKFDLRRWANCYGADCGWGVSVHNHKGLSCKTYDECIKFISDWKEGEGE